MRLFELSYPTDGLNMAVFYRTSVWAAAAVSYLTAGSLLHAITALEIILAFAIALVWNSAFLNLLVLAPLPLLTQLDARSRYQEFKKLRDQMVLYGPDHRLFRSVCNSRCRRDAALAAARQLGYEIDCRSYFTAAGYRWYHLLPDFISSQPGFLFARAFWRATFFAPSYHARFPRYTNKKDLVSVMATVNQ